MEPVVKIVAGPVEYGNAPFWCNRKGVLYFVNVFKSEIHQFDPHTNRHTFARVPGYKPVGFIIPIEDFENKFMIGYGSDLAAVTWDGQSDQVSKLVIVENVETISDNRISDGKISPQGILFVGTSGPGHLSSGNLQMNQGALYSFKNCDMKKLLSNVSTSAGMAWNNNGNMFFYTDCSEYRVERYCFNSDTCDLGKGCVLYEFKDDNLPGFPCGITIDFNEHLWVSCFNGGQVLKIDSKTGKATTKIEIPHCPQITSLTFGGKNLDILYVTSATYNMKSMSKNAGAVFQVSGLGVKGAVSKALKLITNE